jgi:hypothetical protein
MRWLRPFALYKLLGIHALAALLPLELSRVFEKARAFLGAFFYGSFVRFAYIIASVEIRHASHNEIQLLKLTFFAYWYWAR